MRFAALNVAHAGRQAAVEPFESKPSIEGDQSISEHNATTVQTAIEAPAVPTNPNPEHYASRPVGIFETATRFALVADMPGVSQSNLEVSVANNVLTIKGHVTQRLPGKERYQGFKPVSILRRFRLENVFDTERMEAELRNGVLQGRST